MSGNRSFNSMEFVANLNWQYKITITILVVALAFADPRVISIPSNPLMLSVFSVTAVITCYAEQRRYMFVDKTRSPARYLVATIYLVASLMLFVAVINLAIFCEDKYYASIALYGSSISFAIACMIATYGQTFRIR